MSFIDCSGNDEFTLGRKRKRSVESDNETKSEKKKADIDDISDNELFKLNNYISCNDNHVRFYTVVNNYTAVKFQECVLQAITFINKKFNELSQYGFTDKLPLIVHIHSPGGGVFSVLTMIDFIRYQQKIHNFEYHSIIEGSAASAGTLLSVVADKRYIMKNSYMLIHQLSGYMCGKYNDMKDDMDNSDEIMRRIKKIYIKNTNLTNENIDDILSHDLYWRAKKCLKHGLVDEII